MADILNPKEKEIKEQIKDDIIARLVKDKLATESSELPIRSSYVNKDLTEYNIIDAHYQFIKDEILQELADYLLKEKTHNEVAEMPIRASYVNSEVSDTPILDAHYQKLKDDIRQDIAKQLVNDKVDTEKDAMKIRAAYLHDVEQAASKRTSEKIALRLQDAGMSTKNIADIVNMSEEELEKLFKK